MRFQIVFAPGGGARSGSAGRISSIRDAPQRAAEAVERIVTGIFVLAEFPGLGVALSKDLRQLVLPHGRNAYIVRHHVGESSIVVTSIRHGRERV